MNTAKLSGFAIGVALCATPIFNSAHAQSTNNSAELVLQVQSMRSEIAELRDMVERQQFELNKFKRQVAADQAVEKQARLEAEKAALQASQIQTSQIQASQAGGFNQGTTGNVDIYTQQAANTVPQLEASAKAYNEQNVSGAINADPARSIVNGTEVIERGINADGVNSALSASTGSGFNNDTSLNKGTGLTADTGSVSSEAIAQNVPAVGAVYVAGSNAVSNSTTSITSSANIQPGQQPILSVPNSSALEPTIGSDLASGADGGLTSGAINAAEYPTAPVQQVFSSNTGVLSDAQNTESPNIAILEQPVTEIAQPEPELVKFTEDQYYDRGFDFLKQSKYDEAITVFNEQISQYPNGELADDAHYWIAEALFINRKSAEAKPHLRAIIDNYPQSARLPDAMLKTAYIEQDMGNMIEARILLQEIVSRHPSSNAAIAARNRLDNLKVGN